MSAVHQNQAFVDEFERFFRAYYEDDIYNLARLYPKDEQSLHVDWRDLYRFDPDLADDWIENPDTFRGYAEDALYRFDTPVDQNLTGAHVRVKGLNEDEIISTASINSDLIGQFVGIEGRVRKKSQKEPVPEEGAFECQRCGTLNRIPNVGGESVTEPHECKGCERQGPFILDKKQSDWKDRQLVRIQQPPEETAGGMGASIDVIIEDDAVSDLGGGRFQPGAHVTVTGECTVEDSDNGNNYYLEGDLIEEEESDFGEIEITQQDINRIREIANGEEGDPYFVAAETLAGGIYGFDDEKLGLVLQLFRGVRSQLPDGSFERGDPHILLLGDPSTGKSSVLRRVTNLSPRSSYASGQGASASGLTASVVPSEFGDAKWGVEAGALVLADQGVAAIDEVDKVGEDAVRSLHDALESPQVVEVNKAGINTELPSRTALLAAGNPEHGRFDPNQPIAKQFDIEPSLMSRFDLIFTIIDEPDEQFDGDMAEHVIRRRQTGHEWDHHMAPDAEPPDEVDTPIDEEILRKWIAYARQNYYPRIDRENDDLIDKLVNLYTSLRSAAYDSGISETAIPVTARKLEAFQRLAEASARVRLSNTVNEADVERAADLVLKTLRDVGVNEEGEFDADIVETGVSKPSRDYRSYTEDLLEEVAAQSDDGGIPVDELKAEVGKEDGVRWSDVQYCISRIKAKGDLYESEDGVYRLTNDV